MWPLFSHWLRVSLTVRIGHFDPRIFLLSSSWVKAIFDGLLSGRMWIAWENFPVQNTEILNSSDFFSSRMQLFQISLIWVQLRYESSTLILYKELSSPIFQSLSVSESVREHWCLAANLKIGIYNVEMVCNRLLGNGWSDFDDFFVRPPWNFNSDEKMQKSAL